MIAIATLLAIAMYRLIMIPKKNSKGMEDDMFGDFATTNDDVTTVKEDPMLDIDDSKATTVVEKDDSNSNVVGDSNVSPDNDSKENSKGMEDDMFGDLLQLMTTCYGKGGINVGYRR